MISIRSKCAIKPPVELPTNKLLSTCIFEPIKYNGMTTYKMFSVSLEDFFNFKNVKIQVKLEYWKMIF